MHAFRWIVREISDRENAVIELDTTGRPIFRKLCVRNAMVGYYAKGRVKEGLN